jgi:hypothetical protein
VHKISKMVGTSLRASPDRNQYNQSSWAQANLNGNFMSLFPTHPDFGNCAEEFHLHETLSAPIKLLSSLSSLIWCHISIINAYETLMKPHWDWPKHTTSSKFWMYLSLKLYYCVAGISYNYTAHNGFSEKKTVWTECTSVVWIACGRTRRSKFKLSTWCRRSHFSRFF